MYISSGWLFNVGSGIVFYGFVGGAISGWFGALFLGVLGGLGGLFYSTFK